MEAASIVAMMTAEMAAGTKATLVVTTTAPIVATMLAAAVVADETSPSIMTTDVDAGTITMESETTFAMTTGGQMSIAPVVLLDEVLRRRHHTALLVPEAARRTNYWCEGKEERSSNT